MLALATPLWGQQLGLSMLMVGLVSAARSISPLAYAIHFGSLMDSIGARRFLIVFAVQCAVLPVLYPILPFAAPFLVLQLVLGLAAATVWLAAQTAIARIAAGDSVITGRFSFFTSLGTVCGPLILGLAWNRFGPIGGYGVLALWGCVLLTASILLPARKDVVRRKIDLRILIPDLRTYTESLAGLKRPIVAFVIACTFIRLSCVSMLESFYPLMLQALGFSAAAIGALFAIGNLVSSPSSLLASWWIRICGSPHRALTVSVALCVMALGVLPTVQDFWSVAVVIAVYGFGLGISMPLMFSLLSQGVAADLQGAVAGVRATANRLAAFVLPLLMGIVAEGLGLAGAFAAISILLLATLIAAEMLYVRRI
ncbi:MAG: Arabinose efflux permease [Rhodobacteraceae bacterium HLUCCA12]|nr:MAG: Arabinose efflux permease [Rhodobacteraceae bacterium HLUCCA12]